MPEINELVQFLFCQLLVVRPTQVHLEKVSRVRLYALEVLFTPPGFEEDFRDQAEIPLQVVPMGRPVEHGHLLVNLCRETGRHGIHGLDDLAVGMPASPSAGDESGGERRDSFLARGIKSAPDAEEDPKRDQG